MNKLEILAKALEYMEQHLQEDIKTEDVAIETNINAHHKGPVTSGEELP